MRHWLPVVLAAFLLGCAGSSEVELGMVDASRFKRIGVLPFSDGRKKGLEAAELVAKGLYGRGFDVADPRQMEATFKSLRLEAGSGLSPASLGEIRRRTYADALLFGSVESRWREVSVVMIDTDLGEPVITAKLRPRRGKAFSSVEEIARDVVTLVSAKPPKSDKDLALPDLPEPK